VLLSSFERKITHENYTGGSRHVRRARGANHENNHDITLEAACRTVGALYSQQKAGQIGNVGGVTDDPNAPNPKNSQKS